MSVRLSLKISVNTEPIEFYSSDNISTGPVVILGHFLGGETPQTPKKNKNPPQFKKKNLMVSGKEELIF